MPITEPLQPSATWIQVTAKGINVTRSQIGNFFTRWKCRAPR